MDRNDEGWQADDVLIPIQVITMFSRKLNGTGKISPVFILYQENSYFYTEPGVMYKTIFVINIIIYMCLQHSNVLWIYNCGFPIFEERIRSPKECVPLRIWICS